VELILAAKTSRHTIRRQTDGREYDLNERRLEAASSLGSELGSGFGKQGCRRCARFPGSGSDIC